MATIASSAARALACCLAVVRLSDLSKAAWRSYRCTDDKADHWPRRRISSKDLSASKRSHEAKARYDAGHGEWVAMEASRTSQRE